MRVNIAKRACTCAHSGRTLSERKCAGATGASSSTHCQGLRTRNSEHRARTAML